MECLLRVFESERGYLKLNLGLFEVVESWFERVVGRIVKNWEVIKKSLKSGEGKSNRTEELRDLGLLKTVLKLLNYFLSFGGNDGKVEKESYNR